MMEIITLERNVLRRNDEIAQDIRALFQSHNIFAINMMSSPGSGKTTIIEKTIDRLKDVNISVITGDVQTANDAERLAKHNIPVVQLVTSGSCHLDSKMIKDALDRLDLDWTELLIIENVGNLVCPSGFDLGEEAKVVMLSTTEGADKPEKYPSMFHQAEAAIINKIDLLPYVDFSMNDACSFIRRVNPDAEIFEISCMNNEGIEEWATWLLTRMRKRHAVELK